MSIQKKSLISTLKTAKKANVASSSTNEVDAKGAKVASMRQANLKTHSMRQANTKQSFRQMKGLNQRSFRKA